MSPAPSPAPKRDWVAPEVQKAKPGPWGDVEYYDTYLEAPDALLKRLTLPSEQTVWSFPGYTEARVIEVFEKADLTIAQLNSLGHRSRWSVIGGHIRVFPESSTVESLSPKSRLSIYNELARWPENPLHRDPIVFDRSDLSRTLDRSDLPGDLIDRISRLVYQSGNITLFSDFPLLLQKLTHPRFERQLVRVFTRSRTLIVRLHIGAESNLEELAEYWTAHQRHRRSLPLIRAIALTEGIERLDIAHFLPQSPRGQLYTYPSMADVSTEGRAPDSLWSAVNFFTIEPIPIYLDSPDALEKFQRLFKPSTQSWEFGDVLLLHRHDSKQALHACVYIADDIVYTKPNPSFYSPWIMSRLSDVIDYNIRADARVEITSYRLNA